jgi:sortase A
MTRSRTLLWIQRLLFAAGLVILGICGAAWMDSRLRQAEGNRELDRILSRKSTIAAPGIAIPDGGLIGKVEIPKLHLSAIVFQGADSSILDHGVGHVDTSALPGQPGNVVLAAHRDTFFRSLRNIRKGDLVTVTTESGPRTYQVDSTEVVKPTETSVLDPTAKPTLTLITCYPFYYVGHAPRRFIVRAVAATPSGL